jgi:hypothetical protein
MIAHTWKIWDTTTADQHDGVLLEVVTFAADVGPNLLTVSKAHAGDFAEGGVRLLWGFGGYFDTNTSLERGVLLINTGFERVVDGA